MLSPMDLILKLRDHLTDKGAAVTSKAPWVPVVAFNNTQGNQLAMMAAGKGQQESASTTLAYDPSLIEMLLQKKRFGHVQRVVTVKINAQL